MFNARIKATTARIAVAAGAATAIGLRALPPGPGAVPPSIAAGHTDVATQAPQASRQAAPPAAKAAAVVMWVYAGCFGLPAIPVAVYLLRVGRLPWLFDTFPMYGGPWYDIGQPERFAAQLGAFLVVMLVVSWGGWLLWRGLRAGAVVAVATIPLEALFWYGFALPIPPLLALVRTVLVIAAWPRLHRRQITA